MIGTSDYGEVRLSANGGLQKVNQHFLQRHGIKRVAIDSRENTYIARSLMDALSGKVSADCLREIRGRLGLGLDNEMVDTPLTCRTIRAVIELADKDQWGGNALSESDLKTAIGDYNAQAGAGERIKLGSDELKVLSRRYGAQLANALRGEGRLQSLGTAIKDIAAKENLKGGSKELGVYANRAQSATVSGDVNEAMTKTPLLTCMQDYIGLRGTRLDAIAVREHAGSNNGERRQLLTTGEPFQKTDFGRVDLMGFGNKDLEDAIFGSQGQLDTKLAGRILDHLAKTYSSNVTRNQVNCKIGDKPFPSIEVDPVKEEVRQANEDMIREFASELMRQHPKMTPCQLAASLKVFNQRTYSMPKFFGLSCAELNNLCEISFDGDDVKMNFRFSPKTAVQGDDTQEQTGPFRWEFRIDKDGMMLTEYLGRDVQNA